MCAEVILCVSCSSMLCFTGLEVEAAMVEYFCLPSTSCYFNLTHKGSRADMRKYTHTAPTAFLFVSNLGCFNKSHSSFQSFRPIRDRQCSEGIQTQRSPLRTTSFLSVEDALRRVAIANNIAFANLREPSWMRFAPQLEAYLQDKKKKFKRVTKEQKGSNSHSFHIIRHPWIISME